MNSRTLFMAGMLSALALVPVAYAADTNTPTANEQATGTATPGASPADTLKTGSDPACKDILANQPKHTKAEIEKCGKPSE
jgi:hypothetical protein